MGSVFTPYFFIGGFMGLDMNLYRAQKTEKIRKYDESNEEEEFIEPEYWDHSVAYWRKANHIHNWFVCECQNGKDDCNPYYVPQKKLLELRSHCIEILLDFDKAPDVLPSAEGFFFGGTSYDEYYFSDISNTISQIDEIFSETDWETQKIIYQASW